MRHLALLTFALILALFGLNQLADMEIFAPYILRDGLIIVGVAALIFALGSTSFFAHQTDSAVVKNKEPEPVNPNAADQTPADQESGEAVSVSQTASLSVIDPSAITRSASSRSAANRSATIVFDELVPKRLIRILAVAIIALGALLRYWAFRSLPPDCIGTECLFVLDILNEQGLPQPLGEANSVFEILTSIVHNFVKPSLESIRTASIVVGVATLAVFYAFATKFVRPLGALAATLLLALHPWHIAASAAAQPEITIPFLLSAGLWGLLSVPILGKRGQSSQRLVRVLLGAILGILLLAVAGFEYFGGSDGNLFWLLVINLLSVGLILLFAACRWFTAIWLVAAAAIIALPLAIRTLFFASGATATADAGSTGLRAMSSDLLQTLLWRGSIGSIGSLGENSLLGLLVAALTILGIGTLLRAALSIDRTPTRWPAAIIVLLQLLFFGAMALLILRHAQQTNTAIELSSQLLILLPIFFAAVAAALDQLITGFAVQWRRLIRPQTVAIVATLGLILLSAPRLLGFVNQLSSISLGGNAQIDSAMGRYLAEQLQIDLGRSPSAGPGLIGNRTYFLPPQSLGNPALRLLSGPDFETAELAGMVRGFDMSRDLLFVNAEGVELVYLVPFQDRNLMTLLERVYPRGVPNVQIDERSGTPLFTAYSVSQNDLRASQGLRGFYFAGTNLGADNEAQSVVEGQALNFDWIGQPPNVSAPFSARWEGSLHIPVDGEYTFFFEGDNVLNPSTQNDESAVLSIDHIRVLDTAAGRPNARQLLARGAYRIDINYQTTRNTPGFKVLWQRPNGPIDELTQEFLQSNSIPSIGLLGTYFGNANFEGEPILRQKDLVLGTETALPANHSVRWTGQLAAPRAGEYMLGVQTKGEVALRINAIDLFDTEHADANQTTDEASTLFDQVTKSLIYLDQGWHNISVDYVPSSSRTTADDTPALQIYWRQPGSAFAPLESEYLSPIETNAAPIELPLPPATALEQPDLSMDESSFAFSITNESYKKEAFQQIIPPAELPSFAPTLVWQTQGGCGAAEGQFAEPRGVAIEPTQGRIFVADTGNRRVVQYDVALNQVTRVYESPDFEEPFDVDIRAIADRSLPLVLDAVSQQIFEIDPDVNGADAIKPIPQQTSFYRPRGFAVDVLGNVLVADTGGGRVVVMDPEGRVLAEYGGQGSDIARGQPVDVMGGLRNVWLLTAEDGRLWNLRSFELDNGSLTVTKPTSTLRGPHFAELPNGGFLLTDPERRLLLLHSASGKPVRQFGLGNFLRKPVGIDMTVVNGQPFMAVIDMEACMLSLWQLDTRDLNS